MLSKYSAEHSELDWLFIQFPVEWFACLFSTNRVDHSNTRLSSQLDRNPGRECWSGVWLNRPHAINWLILSTPHTQLLNHKLQLKGIIFGSTISHYAVVYVIATTMWLKTTKYRCQGPRGRSNFRCYGLGISAEFWSEVSWEFWPAFILPICWLRGMSLNVFVTSFVFRRLWWQQSELHILRTPHPFPAAQPMRWPDDGPLGAF